MQFRDLKAQYEALKTEIDAGIQGVIDSTSFILGKPVTELENQLAAYVGKKHCVGCANGTDALQLALMIWGVGPGDAVFTTDFTYFASAGTSSILGATPVFVDIDMRTFNMSPESLEKAILEVIAEGKLKPKAIVPVDLFGLPADYPKIEAIAKKIRLGFLAKELDIGGGLGVRYVKEQPILDIGDTISRVCRFMKEKAKELGIELPTIAFEPGRSIVADAGLTVYTVGTVKRIPGYKTYVSVDGGMTDNPRFALYGSPYTILPVMDKGDGECETVSVVGRCCESGDILQENIPIRRDICRGELLACLTTGAYHYSMASNYNRIPRPPVVMLKDGEGYLAVRRERPEDITSLDI